MGVSPSTCRYHDPEINCELVYSAAAFLANRGIRVSLLFETSDAVVASAIPLPDCVRRSRSVLF